MKKIITVLFALLLAACDNISDNSKLLYGKTGLPKKLPSYNKSKH